jgi:hypothetical protein
MVGSHLKDCHCCLSEDLPRQLRDNEDDVKDKVESSLKVYLEEMKEEEEEEIAIGDSQVRQSNFHPTSISLIYYPVILLLVQVLQVLQVKMDSLPRQVLLVVRTS